MDYRRTVGRHRRTDRAEAVADPSFPDYLETLDGVAEPAGTLALFDLDRTLISGYSVTALARERFRTGAYSLRHLGSQLAVVLRYGLGRADYHELLSRLLKDLVGMREDHLARLGEQAFQRRIRGWIFREARALIERHRQHAHHIVMVTSATRYQAAPIARELGVDHLCCTELGLRDGAFTGEARPCHGTGKREAAQAVARHRGTSLDRAYFYSDSRDDLPLLEAVGRPVVANPRPSMLQLAIDRGWPWLRFADPLTG